MFISTCHVYAVAMYTSFIYISLLYMKLSLLILLKIHVHKTVKIIITGMTDIKTDVCSTNSNFQDYFKTTPLVG